MNLVVDAHAHILDEQYLHELQQFMQLEVSTGDKGQTLLRKGNATVAWHRPEFFDLDDRVRVMDAKGISMRLVSLSSPSIYDWPAADQIRMARHINGVASRAAQRHPTRFRALATLPLGDTAAALDELDRVFDDPYTVGIAIGSHIGGKPLDHPDLEPIWAAINRKRIPVVEHPMLPLGSEHLDAYELPLRVGFVYETTTAVTRMIYGGVFERFPDFPFVLAHTGGALLSLLERLDNGYRLFPDCRKFIDKLPSEYAQRLYYDTCAFHGPVIKMALDVVGSSRLLWGSDDPFIGAGTEYLTDMKLDPADTAAILGGNAMRIFGLDAKDIGGR